MYLHEVQLAVILIISSNYDFTKQNYYSFDSIARCNDVQSSLLKKKKKKFYTRFTMYFIDTIKRFSLINFKCHISTEYYDADNK